MYLDTLTNGCRDSRSVFTLCPFLFPSSTDVPLPILFPCTFITNLYSNKKSRQRVSARLIIVNFPVTKLSVLFLQSLELFDHLWNDFEEVSDDGDICDVEDLCFWIVVNSYDVV